MAWDRVLAMETLSSMIAYIIIILWLVFLTVLVFSAAYTVNTKCRSYMFQDTGIVDIPYITIDIQGVPMNMIVDSGGAVSIITASALEGIAYEKCQRQVSLNAITGESIPSAMVTIPISIGNHEVIGDFIVHDTDDFANFGSMYGITIHGLLGNEFFEKTGCRIDYRKHSVTLY